MQHFDFSTKQTVNPLVSIESFYVNPSNGYSAMLLDIKKKAEGFGFYAGFDDKDIPVVFFPIGVLQLGVCSIKWTSDIQGQIYKTSAKGNTCVMYFKLMGNGIMRIDTVLWR